MKALLAIYVISRFLTRFLFVTMKGLLIIFGISWFAMFLLLIMFYFRRHRHKSSKEV